MRAILIGFFVMSVIFDCRSQEIPKRANQILIEMDSSDCWIQINRLLTLNNFGILNSDKESGIITTSEHPFKNGFIKLNILIDKKSIILSGSYKDDISIDLGSAEINPSWNKISYIGQRNSISMNAWNELISFVNQIPGQKKYLIK